MKKIVFVLMLKFFLEYGAYAQIDSSIVKTSKLEWKGYAQIDYNQPIDVNLRKQGSLDIHRLVLLNTYHFNQRTLFSSEIEFEHVSEVYVEQAFLQHRLSSFANFKAGLLLVPFGMINQYHEPPLYFSVERPLIDNVIAPTTWREIGLGFEGYIQDISLGYSAFVVNGFSGYDGEGLLGGSSVYRKARQKGAESYINHPNLALRAEFKGLPRTRIGASYYTGKTQSTLINNVDKRITSEVKRADSSIISVQMFGADVLYESKSMVARAQVYYTMNGNTNEYNTFTAIDGTINNLAEAVTGHYIEAGYNVFRLMGIKKYALTPFIHYEWYNLHYKTSSLISSNKSYRVTRYNTGFNLALHKGAVLKADVDFIKTAAKKSYAKVINTGIAIMF